MHRLIHWNESLQSNGLPKNTRGEAIAWSYKNATKLETVTENVLQMHSKKIHTHTYTQTRFTHASIISTLTKGETRRKARLKWERRAFFWLPPSIRKLRYQQQMDGLLEGYSGFNWPRKICRFVLQSRPDSDIDSMSFGHWEASF